MCRCRLVSGTADLRCTHAVFGWLVRNVSRAACRPGWSEPDRHYGQLVRAQVDDRTRRHSADLGWSCPHDARPGDQKPVILQMVEGLRTRARFAPHKPRSLVPRQVIADKARAHAQSLTDERLQPDRRREQLHVADRLTGRHEHVDTPQTQRNSDGRISGKQAFRSSLFHAVPCSSQPG